MVGDNLTTPFMRAMMNMMFYLEFSRWWKAVLLHASTVAAASALVLASSMALLLLLLVWAIHMELPFKRSTLPFT